ncbi:Aquaporin-9 [Orchesella cincta]|uniref:Aquaporin-9 n=1 Tax=Orchesella cincta TaxID=48709 RepID=A0A1D2MBG0_ORCCI|nr:Aquaporin-9 [Orchesella cincta]
MSKPAVTPLMEIGKRRTRIGVSYVREAIGEFYGTLILCFMCVGASAQYHIKNHDGYESQIVPVLGIILGIMIATVTTGGLSGAHINPAVTVSLAVAGEMSWLSVPGYVISQFLGAIVGSLLGWSLVHPILHNTFVGPLSNLTIMEVDMAQDLGIAGIFSPFRDGYTVGNGIATELVLTCFLITTLCAAVDSQSVFKPPKYLLSIIMPLVIAGFAFSHDMPSGTLLNPARDLGPRIAAWILGWDAKYVFKSTDWNGNEQHWWLVGLIGPMLGGVLGAFIYSFVIGPQVNLEHLDESNETHDKKRTEVLAAKPEGDWRSTVFVPKPQQAANGGYPNNNIPNPNGAYQQPQQPYGGGGYPNQAFNNKGNNNTTVK